MMNGLHQSLPIVPYSDELEQHEIDNGVPSNKSEQSMAIMSSPEYKGATDLCLAGTTGALANGLERETALMTATDALCAQTQGRHHQPSEEQVCNGI